MWPVDQEGVWPANQEGVWPANQEGVSRLWGGGGGGEVGSKSISIKKGVVYFFWFYFNYLLDFFFLNVLGGHLTLVSFSGVGGVYFLGVTKWYIGPRGRVCVCALCPMNFPLRPSRWPRVIHMGETSAVDHVNLWVLAHIATPVPRGWYHTSNGGS